MMTRYFTLAAFPCTRLRGYAYVLVTLVLAACGGGGGSGNTGGSTGFLRVALTDAPCDYKSVYITVEKVAVHTSSAAADTDMGWREIVLPTPRRIDLRMLTNGVLEELGSMPLPAGTYQQVRLVLAANSSTAPTANAVVMHGSTTEMPMDTPSGMQTGLKLRHTFEVPVGQTADLVLDFDACKSVVSRGNSGQFNLKPVMSAMARLTTGIEGYVNTTVANGTTTVSAQKNGVPVRATAPDATGRFLLSPIPEGSYSVVVVSDGFVTSVVDQVPVALSIGKTTLNSPSTSIAPVTSTMAFLGGTVSAVSGSTSSPLTDATVRVTQSLLGGPNVELASRPVDALDASYSLKLPLGAPVKATYVAGTTTLSFGAPDTAVAGKYAATASSPSYATPRSVNLTLTGNTTQPFTFP